MVDPPGRRVGERLVLSAVCKNTCSWLCVRAAQTDDVSKLNIDP